MDPKNLCIGVPVPVPAPDLLGGHGRPTKVGSHYPHVFRHMCRMCVRYERSHLFLTPLLLVDLRLLLRLLKILELQLRLQLTLRKRPSNSYQKDRVYLASWGKIYVVSILSLIEHKYGWSVHVRSTIQRDTARNVGKKPHKTCQHLLVSYVGHAFQTFHAFWTCHVITSNNFVNVQLLTK